MTEKPWFFWLAVKWWILTFYIRSRKPGNSSSKLHSPFPVASRDPNAHQPGWVIIYLWTRHIWGYEILALHAGQFVFPSDFQCPHWNPGMCWFSCEVVSNSWNPMDCSPPGSSVHGISQARILEWKSWDSVWLSWLWSEIMLEKHIRRAL